MEIVNKERPVIAWWSGGVRSAVTCKLCVDHYGKENVRVVFIDTRNEDDDTYRFKAECEKWYEKGIETISSDEYEHIEDVWFDFLSLGLSKGAICSSELKIKVRQQFIKKNPYSYQAFGYDIGEIQRAKDMKKNNSHLRPIFPLLSACLDKFDCIKFVQAANSLFLKIELPITYRLGLENNNCFKTGCVQGGIGYWQWMQTHQPEKFEAMAKREHEITNLKGKPVTICKDQSKGGGLVFLKPHPDYPTMKDISMMKGRPPEMLIECNGFCSDKAA
jgi:hypothetical protein